MTAISRLADRPRRNGQLGVHSMHRVGMAVPDLDVASRFYTRFGLDVRQEDGGLGLYTSEGTQCWARLTEGPVKRLHYLSFGCFAEDLVPLQRRLKQYNVAQLDPPSGLPSDGIWFRDPDGMLVEVCIAAKSSPDTRSLVAEFSAVPGIAAAPSRSLAPVVRPRRLAHVLVFTADVERAICFYSAILGLRLSDRSGNTIAFMHGIHGSDHHLTAFAHSAGAGLHHLSWDVASVDEVGLGAMQMAQAGHAAGWGLGRHVLGSNYFHYVRDPWGSYSEYSCGIDYIPTTQDWHPGDHAADDAFFLWGPMPPQDFAFNYEAGV